MNIYAPIELCKCVYSIRVVLLFFALIGNTIVVKKLLLLSVLTAGFFLLFFAIRFKGDLAEAQTGNVDWPQLQHDSAHTGRTSAFVAPNYQVKWAWMDESHTITSFTPGTNKNITDSLPANFVFPHVFAHQMQPVIVSGKAYFGAMNGKLFAVDALSGATVWQFSTNGPILGTAAVANNTVVVGSMDSYIYGLDASSGAQKWRVKTNAGISAAPVIFGSSVYVGSRDGSMYALDVSSGAQKWKYATRVEPAVANSPFNNAPIMMPAAVSEDGGTVVFGAENMFFYALSTSSGSEKWAPKKLIGETFMYSWPVIKGNLVIVRTVSLLNGAEGVMEEVLDALPSTPTMSEERTAILNWLNQNPLQKSMYVLDIQTGSEPFQVGMGRVTGNNFVAYPPVVDNQNRILTYWRSKRATFFKDGAAFGTKYCPDVSALNPTTGERITIPNSQQSQSFCPELDNGFSLSIGGDYMYMLNHFRGIHALNVATGKHTFVTARGSDYSAQSPNIIYYGSFADSDLLTGPPTSVDNAIGFSSVSIATTNGTSLLYANEGDAHFIVALSTKP